MPITARYLIAALAVAPILSLAGAEESAPAKPLSLQAAVAFALEHSPRLALAQQRVAQSEARQHRVRAELGGQLNLQGAYRLQGPEISFPTGPGSSVTIFPDAVHDINANYSRVFPLPKARHATVGAAALDTAAAEDQYAAERNAVRLEVTTAFIEALRAADMVAVAKQALERARQNERLAKARFDSGASPRFDLIRAEAETASAEHDLVRASTVRDLKLAALSNAMGATGETKLVLTPPAPSDRPMPVLEAALAAARRSRPELRSLERSAEAARQRVTLARAEKWPSLVFDANYDIQTATGFAEDKTWNASLAVRLPIFDSHRARAAEEEARAGVETALRLRRQQLLAIELQVRQAVLRLAETKERLKAADKAVAQATEALRIARLRYREGEGANIEVTDAQLALTSAERDRSSARYDRLLAWAEYEYAVGIAPGS